MTIGTKRVRRSSRSGQANKQNILFIPCNTEISPGGVLFYDWARTDLGDLGGI